MFIIEDLNYTQAWAIYPSSVDEGLGRPPLSRIVHPFIAGLLTSVAPLRSGNRQQDALVAAWLGFVRTQLFGAGRYDQGNCSPPERIRPATVFLYNQFTLDYQ